MRKSSLLGGIARIVREPSREEMRSALLRRLGAGHILDGNATPDQAGTQASPPEKPDRK